MRISLAIFALGMAFVVATVAGAFDRPVAAPAPAAPDAYVARVGSPSASPSAVRRFARNDRLRVTPEVVDAFRPLYYVAARRFGVSWHLIASVHKQETAFSAAPSTYFGRNFAGCCAGPFQMNLANRPVSTWTRFRNSYRLAPRPAGYPHATATHPSPYDDFDAVMAAGRLLRADGATTVLDGSAWRAAYRYYGPDATGVVYADQVLARARTWATQGFCPACELDAGEVARVHAAWAPG